MQWIDRWDAENALSVLKGLRLDDRHTAARQVAARLLFQMRVAEAEGLVDWLYKESIDGDATIEDLIVKWLMKGE